MFVQQQYKAQALGDNLVEIWIGSKDLHFKYFESIQVPYDSGRIGTYSFKSSFPYSIKSPTRLLFLLSIYVFIYLSNLSSPVRIYSF